MGDAEQCQERPGVRERERRDDARARDQHRREADGHHCGDEQKQAELAIAARAQADGAHGSVCSSCATTERADSLERREWSKRCRRRVAGSVARTRLRWTSQEQLDAATEVVRDALVDRHLARRRIDADEVRPAQPDQPGPQHAQEQRDRPTRTRPAGGAAAAAHRRSAAEAGHQRGHGDQGLAVERAAARARRAPVASSPRGTSLAGGAGGDGTASATAVASGGSGPARGPEPARARQRAAGRRHRGSRSGARP